MKKLLVSFIVACVSSNTFAETYLCITEAAGGIHWNKDKWSSAKFVSGEKFLLKENAWYAFGRKNPEVDSCKNVQTMFRETLKQCVNQLVVVRFNTSTLRFSYFYLSGFTDGEDKNNNTPSVSVGTCSKID